MMRRFLLSLVCGSFLFNAAWAVEDVEDTSESPSADGSGVQLYSDQGWVILDEQVLRGPFRITGHGQQVTVNGTVIDLPADFVEATDDSYFEEEAAASFRPRDREFERGVEREDRGARGNGAFRRGRPGTRGRQVRGPTAMGVRVARRLEAELSADAFVVFVNGNHPIYVGSRDTQYLLCTYLTARDELTAEERDRVLTLSDSEGLAAEWSAWVKSFRPDASERALLEKFREDSQRVISENNRQVSAVRRLEFLAYPLTVVGMFLGVVAFGSMLQWISRGLGEPGHAAPHGARFAAHAILLMMAMSAIDLVWTILAVQAGMMRETNPLAMSFLRNPIHLAAFKVGVTGFGLAILFLWRHRQPIQQATWWMCLVCVLLTFRWVVFDSMVQ